MDLEDIIYSNLSERMKVDDGLCVRLWESLTNIQWVHDDHETWGFTFRTAGGFISDMIERGEYLDWYCCGQAGNIDPYIEALFNKYGWTKMKYNMDGIMTIDEFIEKFERTTT